MLRSLALALILAWPLAAQAQRQTPFVADPYAGWLVEGRVLDARGRPLDGVEVVRVADARAGQDYQPGGFRVRTDSRGRFRFEFAGLGTGAGRTWHLVARRGACRSRVITAHLTEGQHAGREADVALNLVIRMPACARARARPRDRDENRISYPDPGEPVVDEHPAPTRAEIVTAMRDVRAEVLACGGELAGARTVRFTFEGATGRATRARLTGEAPAAVRECVDQAGRRARVPPFTRPRFDVGFPFRFRPAG